MKRRIVSAVTAALFAISAMASIEKNNEFSAAHQKFDNYNYAVAVPEGYERAEAGTKFFNATTKSSINISHENRLIDASSTNPMLQAVYAAFKQEYKNVYQVYINDAEYTWAEKQEGSKMIMKLVIPEDNSSVVITGVANADDNSAIETVKNAIMSVVYIDPSNMPESPVFENSLYSIENQGFRPVAEGSTLVTFCESGDLAKELAMGRQVNFKILMNEDVVKGTKNQKEFAEMMIKALLEDDEVIASMGAVTIDGLPGYEFFVTKTNGAEIVSKQYCTVLFSDKRYYNFQGKANQEIDMYMQKFQAAAQSFKHK